MDRLQWGLREAEARNSAEAFLTRKVLAGRAPSTYETLPEAFDDLTHIVKEVKNSYSC